MKTASMRSPVLPEFRATTCIAAFYRQRPRANTLRSDPVIMTSVTRAWQKTKGVVMDRTYSQGWSDIFGKDLPKKSKAAGTGKPAKKPKPKASEPVAADDASTGSSADIDWKKTRALSIRQPWAELIMRGNKDEEYRSRATKVRGRIAIYASLSKEDLPEAEDNGLDPDELPRGVIIGTVELCPSGKPA